MPSANLPGRRSAKVRRVPSDAAPARTDTASTSERSTTGRALSFRQVEVFHAVAETRSITAASKLLKVSQPSISRTIQRLEDLLGLRLFDRSNRGLIPTTEALRIYEESDAIIRQIRELNAHINTIVVDGADVFRVAATPSVARALVPQVLPALLSKVPSLELYFNVLSPSQMDSCLVTGQTECVVSIGAAGHPLIDSVVVGCGELVAVVHCDHHLASRQVITAADLIGVDLITFESGGQHYIAIEHYLQDSIRHCRVRAVVRCAETAMLLAGENVGVALVDSFAALGASGKNVVIRPLADPSTFQVYVHWNRERPRSQCARLLIPLLRQRIAAL